MFSVPLGGGSTECSYMNVSFVFVVENAVMYATQEFCMVLHDKLISQVRHLATSEPETVLN